MLRRLRFGALVAVTAFAVSACGSDGGEGRAPVDTPSNGLPPLPALELVEATDEQLALFGMAVESIAESDLDTAMTALIALQRTDVASAERARGMLSLAQIYFARAEYDRVALTLDQLEAAAPPTWESALLRGRLYLAIDRPAEAEESIERATRLNLDEIRSFAVLSAVQRDAGRLEDAAETELAMERRILRHAHELSNQPRNDRALQLLDALDAGFTNADASRAASEALAHEDPLVQAHALDVLSRIGGAAIAPKLREYATDGPVHAERAQSIASALEAVAPE